MVVGIILFVIAILLVGLVIYSTFCYAPGEESRREEREEQKMDRCICCGEIIPEGNWVCPTCERKAKEKKDG